MALSGSIIHRLIKKSKKRHELLRQSHVPQSGVIIESPGALVLTGSATNSAIALGSNISQEIHHHHPSASDATDWKKTKPTAPEILREIEGALPFDQHHAREKYVGLTVVWEIILNAVAPLANGWHFIGGSEGGSIADVAFMLTTVTPEVKSASRGSSFLVRGQIRSVSALGVYLESNPNLKLLQRP